MSSDRPTRDALVATAGESIARGSKSFALASRLFDRRTRERVWLLYAWCRACDDLIDGQDHGGESGPVADRSARLAAIQELTGRALDGEWVGVAAFDGLRVLSREVSLPDRYIEDHVAGFELDANGWRVATEDDLFTYCYHVAGVVGSMMAVVMGISPEDGTTMDAAADLGFSFQLANIARDIAEDARAGRCYLPDSWLKEEGLSAETLLLPENRAGTARLSARLANLAVMLEGSGRTGALKLPFRSRWAVLAAAGIYGDIAREVARRGESALDQRVVIGRVRKLAAVTRALGQALADRPGRAPEPRPVRGAPVPPSMPRASARRESRS